MKKKSNNKWLYLTLFLFSIITIVIYLYPFVNSISQSFLKEPIGEQSCVTSDNYARLFKDNDMYNVLKNTLFFSVITTFFCILGASYLTFFLVFVVKSKLLKTVITVSCIIPSMLSSVTVNILWKYAFNYKYGIINNFLTLLGISPIHWLTTHIPAMVVLCFVTVWKNMGYYMILFYAAFQNVKRDSISAALLDGASDTCIYRKIALPSIFGQLSMIIMLNFIDAMSDYSTVYLLFGTQSASLSEIHTLASLFYYYMYYAPDRPMASTLATINVSLILLVLVVCFGVWIFKKHLYKNE